MSIADLSDHSRRVVGSDLNVHFAVSGGTGLAVDVQLHYGLEFAGEEHCVSLVLVQEVLEFEHLQVEEETVAHIRKVLFPSVLLQVHPVHTQMSFTRHFEQHNYLERKVWEASLRR